MKRRVWFILGLCLLLLVLAGAGSVYGYFRYQEEKSLRSLALAEKFRTEGNWEPAKLHYGLYLARHPKDFDTLLKYAEVCTNVLTDRPSSLRRASAAYYQIAINDPSNEDVLKKLMALYEKTNSWADMEYYATYFGDRRPENLWIRYYKALALDRMERVEDAIKAYTGLIEGGTDRPEVYGNLARLLRGKGSAEEAAAILDKAVEAHGRKVEYLVERAQYLLAGRDINLVNQAINEIRTVAPDSPDAALLETRIALIQERWQDAILLADRARTSAPSKPHAYMAIVSAYQGLRDFAKAIEFLDGLDPVLRADYPEFFIIRCELLIQTNQLERADAALKEYRATYPDHKTIFDYLAARKLLAQGNAAAAAVTLTTVTESSPDFPQAQFFLAVASLQSFNRDRARDTLELLLRKYPNEKQARALFEREFGGGQSLSRTEDVARALLGDKQATADALVSTGRQFFTTAFRQGVAAKYRDVITELIESALQRDPANVVAYETLAGMSVSLRDIPGARSALKRAEAAGIRDARLNLPAALVALDEKDIEKARSLFSETSRQPDMRENDIMRWANSFASQGYLDAALKVLSDTIALADESQSQTLAIERVALSIRFGAIDRAFSFLPEAESRAGASEEAQRALNKQKEYLALILMSPGPEQDREQARRLIDGLRGAEPNNSHLQLLEAEALMNQESPDYAGARQIVAAVLEAAPSDLAALSFLAEICLRQDNSAEALTYAERAAAAAPDDVSAQILWAETQLRANQASGAQATLEGILKAQPDETRAMVLLAEAYLNSERLQQAESMIQRLERGATAGRAQPRRLAFLRSRLLLAQGANPQEIEKTLRGQVAANPDNLELVRELATVLSRAGRNEESARLLRTFAEQHSEFVDAWVTLGRFLVTQGNNPPGPDPAVSLRAVDAEASSAFTRALLLRPDYPGALRGLIDLQLRENNPSEALALCERYLRLQPSDPEILFRKATLSAQLGKPLEDALDAVQKAISRSEKPEYLYFRGSLYLVKNQYDLAIEDFLRVAGVQGTKVGDLDLALAEAHLGAGQVDLGRQYYESAQKKAAKGDKLNASRLDRVGKLLAGGGNSP